MARTTPPKEVIQYQEAIKNGPPPCCHTCDHYTGRGDCMKHGMRPPDAFTQAIGECGDWSAEIPF